MQTSLHALLAELSPNGTLLLASTGVLLIFVELNRPGRAIPGALGLLLTLLGVSRFLRFGVQPWAVLLLAVCIFVYGANLWREVPLWLLVPAILATMVGMRALVPRSASSSVALPVAVLCGGLLGTASAVLTRVAHRARRSKALD